MFCCGSSWGIGVYTIREAGQEMLIYGFPPKDMDPHDFSPDWECCTANELEAWKHAKEHWSKDVKE